MATARDVLGFLESIAPSYMKMEWDNVGLLCGDPDKEVHKILVALDPFENVCNEAVNWNADLLVTHHPLIFQPLKGITLDTAIGRCIHILLSHGITAINAHTNLDCAPEGVNHCLATVLGLKNIQVIEPMGTTVEQQPWGLLRMGTVPEQPLDTFLNTVKEMLHCPGLRYVQGSDTVSKICVGGGACASELQNAISAGCDTFVTSDVKYNQFWDAKDGHINLIDAGHFYTENPVCSYLCEKLQAHFPEITVKVSENHTDPMRFF